MNGVKHQKKTWQFRRVGIHEIPYTALDATERNHALAIRQTYPVNALTWHDDMSSDENILFTCGASGISSKLPNSFNRKVDCYTRTVLMDKSSFKRFYRTPLHPRNWTPKNTFFWGGGAMLNFRGVNLRKSTKKSMDLDIPGNIQTFTPFIQVTYWFQQLLQICIGRCTPTATQ